MPRELSPEQARVVAELKSAFAGSRHGLWLGENVFGSDETRETRLRSLRDKGIPNWTGDDIDWVFFKAGTTIGTNDTVKFAFPLLVEGLLRDTITGSPSASIIESKLEYAGFESWPKRQRGAVIEALRLVAEHSESSEDGEVNVSGLRSFIQNHTI